MIAQFFEPISYTQATALFIKKKVSDHKSEIFLNFNAEKDKEENKEQSTFGV